MSDAVSIPPADQPPAHAAGRLAALRRGRVTAFSVERGLGAVEEPGGARFGFHCVEIADGTRRIEVGTRVVFLLQPGHDGALEARQLLVETP